MNLWVTLQAVVQENFSSLEFTRNGNRVTAALSDTFSIGIAIVGTKEAPRLQFVLLESGWDLESVSIKVRDNIPHVLMRGIMLIQSAHRAEVWLRTSAW